MKLNKLTSISVTVTSLVVFLFGVWVNQSVAAESLSTNMAGNEKQAETSVVVFGGEGESQNQVDGFLNILGITFE